MLNTILKNLLDSYEKYPDMINTGALALPSRECVTDLTHQLERLLYPGLITSQEAGNGFSYHIGSHLADIDSTLKELVKNCLNYASQHPQNRMPIPSESNHDELSNSIVTDFWNHLPEIRDTIHIDLQAAWQGDPAAKSYAEIILAYPGLRALGIHRLAHCLHQNGVPILPRMMNEYVHNRTGIDIHPGAQIGPGLFIDHGTGVVIGETTIIGKHVKIYQGVTLGALSIPDPDSGDHSKRHPTIEDDVTIYANSTILGGQTTIGARSVIGSNVWLTHSVAPDTKVLFVQPDLRIKSSAPH